MIGRRRPDVIADPDGSYMPKWSEWEPGDYGFIVEPRMGRTLYVKDPAGNLGYIGKHTITEHEDGTVTLSPSVLFDLGPHPWHGYLVRGVWNETGGTGSSPATNWNPGAGRSTLGWRKP